jgi:hypothetical protein
MITSLMPLADPALHVQAVRCVLIEHEIASALVALRFEDDRTLWQARP